MSQVDTVRIPLSARKNLAFTRLANGVGFIAAAALGLAVFKVPKEKIITAAAVMAAVELFSAGRTACDDEQVTEAMAQDNFGSVQEKLEAAGQGLGLGFAALAVCVAFIKLTTKGKDDEQAN